MSNQTAQATLVSLRHQTRIGHRKSGASESAERDQSINQPVEPIQFEPKIFPVLAWSQYSLIHYNVQQKHRGTPSCDSDWGSGHMWYLCKTENCNKWSVEGDIEFHSSCIAVAFCHSARQPTMEVTSRPQNWLQLKYCSTKCTSRVNKRVTRNAVRYIYAYITLANDDNPIVMLDVIVD